MIPRAFTFHARNEAYSKTIPGDALVVATASSAPDLLDPDTGEERRARSGDIARIAHLVNQLDGIDVFSISVLADDAPPAVSLSGSTRREEPLELVPSVVDERGRGRSSSSAARSRAKGAS
jgi:hypothetical protein